MAAQVYGATRELADIDIDVLESEFEKILPGIKEYIIFGPAQYRDKNWDLWLITLRYKGQEIDIGGARKAKIFDKRKKKWVAAKADFSRSEIKKVLGTKVPVISKNDLINYKRKLRRKVDLLDLRQIEKPRTAAALDRIFKRSKLQSTTNFKQLRGFM